MKSVLFAFLAAATLTACGKTEEAPAPAAVVAPATPATPVASEPAKTDEAKK